MSDSETRIPTMQFRWLLKGDGKWSEKYATPVNKCERVGKVAREIAKAHAERVANYHGMARAAIEAIPDDDEAFLAALAERVHDARFSRPGETYPVLRNFIRALKDAALNESKEGE